VGFATVSALFDQFMAIDDQLHALSRYDEHLSNAHYRLVGVIAATRQDVFVQVLATRAQTDNPRRIGSMADLVARHGGNIGSSNPPYEASNRAILRAVIEGWIAALQVAGNPVRHASSEVARAAARLADASLSEPLRLLFERDLADYTAALAARRPGESGAMAPDAMGFDDIRAGL
jgi:hypothetical protein